MSWTRERRLIFIGGLVFLFFGAWLFATPAVLEKIGIKLSTAEAFIDIRATYGGFELGLAAFLFIAQGKPAWHPAALLAIACTFAGFGFGRIAGIVLAGETTNLMTIFALIEVVAAALYFVAARRAESS